MADKAAKDRAERAGVRVDRTVSPEPEHSTLPKQSEEDLKAEPVDTLDPDVAEAQGRDQ
jgi:hypothetical protein